MPDDNLIQRQVDQLVYSNQQVEKQIETLAKSVTKIADNVAEIALISQKQIYIETQLSEVSTNTSKNAADIAGIKLEIAPLLAGAKDIRAIKNTIFIAFIMAMSGIFYNVAVNYEHEQKSEQVEK